MPTKSEPLERMYSIHEIAKLWGVAPDLVRRIFRGRMVNISGSSRPSWRIPRSLALEVLAERGYDPRAEGNA